MSNHIAKHTKPVAVPVSYDAFVSKAQAANADGKLSKTERSSLSKDFKGMSREDQLQALDFLRNESPTLSKFADNNAAVKTATNKRVGGDQGLDKFLTMVQTAAAPAPKGQKQGPEGFSFTEHGKLLKEFRVLSKQDQQTAITSLKNLYPKLTRSLDGILNPRSGGLTPPTF